MSESGQGMGEELAQWLKEAGRRAASAPLETRGATEDDSYNSPASLHRYVEELAGKPLRSHAELLDYLREVAGSQPHAHRELERRRLFRELILVSLLVVSALQYYYWDVQLQIAALNSVQTYVPMRAPLEKRI